MFRSALLPQPEPGAILRRSQPRLWACTEPLPGRCARGLPQCAGNGAVPLLCGNKSRKMACLLFCMCFCACLLPLCALATVSSISYVPWKVSHQGALAFPRQSQPRLWVGGGTWMCSGPLCFLSSVCRGSLRVRVEICMEGRGVPAWLGRGGGGDGSY